MTIEELRKHKNTLRRALGKSMDAFVEKTDVGIKSISFSRESGGIGPTYTDADGTTIHCMTPDYYYVTVELKL